MTGSYELRHVEQRLCEDDSTSELNVHLEEHGRRIFVRGQASSDERRERVLGVVRSMCPDREVVDELTTTDATLSARPDHVEEIR
jgi:stage III sporulation protein SpoIIIAA